MSGSRRCASGLAFAVTMLVSVGLLLTPDRALAADPVVEPFVGAAESAGLPCASSGGGDWSCREPSDDATERVFYASVSDDEGPAFAASISRAWPDPRPAEPDVLALMERYLELAVGDDPSAATWLRDTHDGRLEMASLERGPWQFDWYAEWDVPVDGVWPAVQLVLSHHPGPEAAPGTPLPVAPSDLDECTLLTEADVESVTGLDAGAGITKDLGIVGAVGCGWGTTPHEIQLHYLPSTSGLAKDGLGDAGEPVEGVGDAARWHWCEACAASDTSSSANGLVVAYRTAYVHVYFEPVDRAAAQGSPELQGTHREWAIALARLIVPRLEAAFEAAAPPASASPPAGRGPGHEGELAAYLTSYGLDCTTTAGTTTTCLMSQADATYLVETTTDASGAVSGIDASVTSLDESMPSDAGGFLRAVAERAPLDDADAVVAWFDGAIAGGDPRYAAEPWTATWSETARGDTTVWALSLRRDMAPGPSPTEAPPQAAPTAVPAPDPPAAGEAGEGPTMPQPFAASVPAPAEVSTDPLVVLQSALLAALLVFLMPFPGQLFNSTLDAHEDEVRRWLRLDRLGAAARGLGAFWASWPGVIGFTCVAALLYGFLDPEFGLHPGSLATFLGMLLGIVLVTAAFAVPTILAHRRLGDRPSLTVVPVSLLIGVLCVLISRLTGFQPGYLYGLLIGLAFARELSAAEEGRATAVGAGLMLGVAFVAWLALGALPDSEAFGVAVGRTTLAALMVAGLEGVVFGLLPMRFLPGEAVYRWNRPLWGALLLAGAFAFFHILINPASGYLSDTSRTPLFTVIALLLGFSLVSVAFWAWFRFRSEPARPVGRGEEGAA